MNHFSNNGSSTLHRRDEPPDPESPLSRYTASLVHTHKNSDKDLADKNQTAARPEYGEVQTRG
jgi:hypothetical protein